MHEVILWKAGVKVRSAGDGRSHDYATGHKIFAQGTRSSNDLNLLLLHLLTYRDQSRRRNQTCVLGPRHVVGSSTNHTSGHSNIKFPAGKFPRNRTCLLSCPMMIHHPIPRKNKPGHTLTLRLHLCSKPCASPLYPINCHRLSTCCSV